jgi:hypothetical protein
MQFDHTKMTDGEKFLFKAGALCHSQWRLYQRLFFLSLLGNLIQFFASWAK